LMAKLVEINVHALKLFFSLAHSENVKETSQNMACYFESLSYMYRLLGARNKRD
jgi:hypothetical protein